MFWIIESLNQLEKLKSKSFKQVFIEIIPVYKEKHPAENIVSLVYVKPLNSSKGYIICLNHSESLSLNKGDVNKLLNSFEEIYTIDKKKALHYFNIYKTYDIGLNGNITFPKPTPIYFYCKKIGNSDYNKIIPLSKHYEYCDEIFDLNKHLIYKPENYFFNYKVPQIFKKIEKNGLFVDKEKFNEHFGFIDGNLVFTNYNFKTLTTRPSNSFGGVNYMALNKNTKCRESFTARNDFLLELDIKSYHPTLIALLIGYDFKGVNPHTYFSKIYGVDYEKSKTITFKQIYGGIFDEYKEVDFFKKTQEYINFIWDKFNKEGYIEVPISKHKIKQKNISEVNPQKLFNYLLQAYETALNVIILEECFKLINNKKSKIVLYVYDSILIDVDNEEAEPLLKSISKVFKKYKLNVGIKVGENYNFS